MKYSVYAYPKKGFNMPKVKELAQDRDEALRLCEYYHQQGYSKTLTRKVFRQYPVTKHN